MAVFLNTYRPLVHNAHGRQAVEVFGLPPFIDASCRREPDLESDYPSITALCRGGNFAPRLREGDVIAYMTKKIAYPKGEARGRRLVAILRVLKSWFPEPDENGIRLHERAARWYRKRGVEPPSNCMLHDSTPFPLDHTDGKEKDLGEWNLKYRIRARKYGVFHACEPIFVDVEDPPHVTDADLIGWFGRMPGTRNPGTLPPKHFRKLIRWLRGQVSDATTRKRLGLLAGSLG